MTQRKYEVLLEAEAAVDSETGAVDLKVDIANLPALLRRDTLFGNTDEEVEEDSQTVVNRQMESPAHLGFTYAMHPID